MILANSVYLTQLPQGAIAFFSGKIERSRVQFRKNGSHMNSGLILPENWQDWLVVFSYLSFTVFIIWRVLISK
ncbi:MAG: hypothetical protein LH647_10245 [Leptolyngbyaceae cyanobacterium CAN_BIN12]|nr:hypothetical protein [Leptolyngbyaceae cyanobacterium CAN_BIN12]